jgi:hypothetical protein
MHTPSINSQKTACYCPVPESSHVRCKTTAPHSHLHDQALRSVCSSAGLRAAPHPRTEEPAAAVLIPPCTASLPEHMPLRNIISDGPRSRVFLCHAVPARAAVVLALAITAAVGVALAAASWRHRAAARVRLAVGCIDGMQVAADVIEGLQLRQRLKHVLSVAFCLAVRACVCVCV